MRPKPTRDRSNVPADEALRDEIQRLRAERDEALEALHAIHSGEVDAIIAGKHGEQVFSLSGAESVYRLIVQTMQEAALTVTPEGTILSCNPQFEALLNASAGAVIGRPLHSFVAPEERDRLAVLLTRSQSEPVKHRLVFQAIDGPQVPTHTTAHVLQQPDGPSLCLVATDLRELESSTETVHRLQAEVAARRAAEEALHTAARFPDENPDPILRVSADGTLLYANHASEPLLRSWARRVGEPLAAEWRASMAEVFRRGDLTEIEVTCDAGQVYACRMVPIVEARYLNIYGRNITDRKQAEGALRESAARFRTLADAIPHLAWIARGDGWIYWYNQRWYDYTGTIPKQMEGWGWQSVHDPETLPAVLERWKAFIATGEPFDMVFPLRGG
jgi:PAS domain S-box-containing protein